jgi:PhnB protein
MGTSTGRKAAIARKRRTEAGKVTATVKRPTAGKKAAIARMRRTSKWGAAPAAVTPSVIPMLSYEDGIAALDWLHRAFGFRVTARLTTPDGRLSHGEMTAGNGLIMLASPTPEYRGPRRHREECEQARKWSAVPWIVDGVLVYVNDLDRHFDRASLAGATILSAIEEGPPGRRYRAEDLEGHRWFFFEADHT